MTSLETALEAIYAGIDEVNDQLDPGKQVPKSTETVLLGPSAALDSLGVVTLLVAVEGRLRGAAGRRIGLATDDRLYADNSPLRTVGAFAEFVAQQLDQKP